MKSVISLYPRIYLVLKYCIAYHTINQIDKASFYRFDSSCNGLLSITYNFNSISTYVILYYYIWIFDMMQFCCKVCTRQMNYK